MTFYYESLTNLIAYGELRTNVFHEFTQIGNVIIFSLLLEQALVSFFIIIENKRTVYLFREKLSNKALQNSLFLKA